MAEYRVVSRFDGGVGWIAYPDERMQRASYALAGDDGLWVVDPVDRDGLDDLLAEHGDVAGVVVCLDRHKRDCAAVARRHDVPVSVPEPLSHVAGDLDAPTEAFAGDLAGSGFRAVTVVDNRLWSEVALTDGETLVVPEAVGTAEYFLVGGERLGVHPVLRLFPPRAALAGLDPERVLVGHGPGLLEDAPAALDDALRGSRRRAPRYYASLLGALLGG